MTVATPDDLTVTDRPLTVKGRLTVKARAAVAWCRVRAGSWRVSRSVPGVYAMVALSLAAGGVVGHFVAGLGPWVSLGVSGLFALRLDSRL